MFKTPAACQPKGRSHQFLVKEPTTLRSVGSAPAHLSSVRVLRGKFQVGQLCIFV